MKNNRPIVAVIPARGGSKGIPRKNIYPIAGKPLIAYSIESALASELIDQVIVSTDDPEIAEISKQFGASVPKLRPAHLSTDQSTDYELFQFLIDEYSKGTTADYPKFFVQLRPTSPIRSKKVLNDGISEFLRRDECTSLRCVSVAKQSPYKMWIRKENGVGIPLLELAGTPEPYNKPRQSLPIAYWQNGFMDIIRPETIQTTGGLSGDKILLHIIPHEVIDIDYIASLKLAEQFIQSERYCQLDSFASAFEYPG